MPLLERSKKKKNEKSQLFVSRMPKMCTISQLISAPLNPITTVENFRRSHPQCEQLAADIPERYNIVFDE